VGTKNRSRCATGGCGTKLTIRRAIIEESAVFPSISSARGDAFRFHSGTSNSDFAICSLFTHHFKDDKVIEILRELSRVAIRGLFCHRPASPSSGILVLHDHRPVVFAQPLDSRRRGAFDPARVCTSELTELAERANLKDIKVERHFPYRLVLTARRKESLFRFR
jgi:hypothetical protein